jgi:hypothetical protein
LDNLTDFNVQTVYKKGRLVYDQGQVLPFPEPEIPEYLEKMATDTFHLPLLSEADFAVDSPKGLIGMIPGEILTENKGYGDVPRGDRELSLTLKAPKSQKGGLSHRGGIHIEDTYNRGPLYRDLITQPQLHNDLPVWRSDARPPPKDPSRHTR